MLSVGARFNSPKRKTDMLNRAYAILEVKAADAEKRTISGIATTPTPDRVGDIIEPLGVKFSNPLPLLHQHDSRSPVGTVQFHKPTKDGIKFTAQLPKIDEPGLLKDRVDLAWQEVKSGLIRGVSIGFRSLEHSMMDDGGIRFLESEVLELSLVTVPANAEATIETVKAYDSPGRYRENSFDGPVIAAIGNDAEVKVSLPASREKASKPKPKTQEIRNMKTLSERKAAFEASREAKSARMTAILEEAGDESLDEAQVEEFDALEAEVKAIDEHLVRLNAVIKSQAAKAVPVNGTDADHASASRGGESFRVSVRDVEVPKGIRFARMARCMAIAHKDHRDVIGVAERLYAHDPLIAEFLKSNVAAATSTHATNAGPLVPDVAGAVVSDFVEYLRPFTILGRFGQGNIPSLRSVPFYSRLVSQTSGGTAYWTAEGAAKPLTSFAFSDTTLLPLKCAAITTATMELLRDSNPSAETLLRDQLREALASKLDLSFIDPDQGAVSGSQPAAITNGATTVVSGGGVDDDAVLADIASVYETWLNGNNRPTNGVWVMSAIVALRLSMMRNPLGQYTFNEITPNGGVLWGLPVITSEHVGYTIDSPSEGRTVHLINAGDIWVADEGVEVRMSTEASLEMDDAPSSNSTTPTESAMVSMFQTNSVAFLVERRINWARRRSDSVVNLTSVEWGQVQ
jgi:HK97 family phage major capsid protein/HK97 family phage prohead protease